MDNIRTPEEIERAARAAYLKAIIALEHPSEEDRILAYGMGLAEDLSGRRAADPSLTLCYGEVGRR